MRNFKIDILQIVRSRTNYADRSRHLLTPGLAVGPQIGEVSQADDR